VPDSKRGRHLCAARRAAKQTRAAVAAEMRRRGRSARLRGSARVAKSGEVSTASRAHGIETDCKGRLPTFLRSSGMAHGDQQATAAGKTKVAAARVLRRLSSLASGARVGGSSGGGRLIKAWGGPLACRPRTGRRASLRLGGGGGVQGGDGRSLGMIGGPRRSATAGRAALAGPCAGGTWPAALLGCASAGGLLGCGARQVKRLGRLAQAGCCAGLLLGWARR
jgi:hypothetical protein